MATELAIAMRRLKAQEALAKDVADLNRKMDLVMAHLGIGTTAPVEEIPADGDESAETDEATADGNENAKADEVPATGDKQKG